MICQNVLTMHHVDYSLMTPSCSNVSLLQTIVPNCNGPYIFRTMVQHLELNLNQHKCTHLRLSLSNQASEPQTAVYKVCGTTLESVTNQRDLGVIVTNNLSWSLHYDKLCQKAYNALHLIKRSLPESAPVYLKKNKCIIPLSAPASPIVHKSGNFDMSKTSHA